MSNVQVIIFGGKGPQIPLTIDGITLEWSRQGAPGKLNFTVIKDDALTFPEGAVVRLAVDGKVVFKGFVFEKSRTKSQHISVTAYDQLRYFKNKDTFKIKNQKASEFLKFVTEQFLLTPGKIEDTGFVIEDFLADNKTIFDAVQDALDLTLVNTGKVFVLYDDAGKICLKDCEKMQADLLINNEMALDFDYKSSIEEMYNVVKLVQKKNGENEVGEVFQKIDEDSVKQYGALQYFDNGLDENANPEKMAAQILELNSRVRRKLSIKGAHGDPTIRGGTSVFIDLHLGDQVVRWRAIVEHVTHTFENDNHRMDLQISGKGLR